MKRVYFKSFGRNIGSVLSTFILNPSDRAISTFQSLEEVLKQRVIGTNTRHHILRDRLSVSMPTEDFPGVYRPLGIVFATDQNPDFCVPFDLMALTDGRTLTAEDYGSDFLPGYKNFVFPNVELMTAAFPNAKVALEALNKFRATHGLEEVHKDKNYNEICFERAIPVTPLALIGRSLEVRRLGHNYKIRTFDSMDQYIMAENHPIKYLAAELLNKSLPFMFDGCGRIAPEEIPA